MTRSLLLVSLAAGALTVPMPASSAATEPAIRQIDVRPAAPVVGAGNSVRLVIDVVAKGVRGRDGVSVKVEPGAPPGPVTDPAQQQSPPPRPSSPPSDDSADEPSSETWDEWSNAGEASPEAWDERPGTDEPSSENVEEWSESDGSPTAPNDEPSTEQPAEAGTRPDAESPVWSAAPGAMRMSGGWQTWRFLPDKSLNRYYPAGTWTVTATAKGPNGTSVTSYASFQLKRESKLGTVRVARAGNAQGVRVSGSLTRVDPRGATDFSPFARQRVEILWRQDSSGTWQRVAEATTAANGAFQRAVPGRTGGYWRVRYLGTGHYAADAAQVRQIN